VADIKINEKLVVSQTGTAEPVLASNVTGGGGLTELGTITSGDISAISASAPTEGTSINHVENPYSTRTTLSTSAEANFWSFSYNKTVASSNLVVTAFVPLYARYSTTLSIGFRYASTDVWCGMYIGADSGGGNMCLIHGVLTGHTTTGSQTLALKWKSQTGESSQKPATTFCPNGSDSSQLNQTVAMATVYEKLTA
jgi:hypothetical protein